MMSSVVAVTVTVALPVFPSALAITDVMPAATPVTTPAPETVAIPEFNVDHATGRPVSGLPLASNAVAMNVVVAPTAMVADPGATVMAAIGVAETTIEAVAVLP